MGITSGSIVAGVEWTIRPSCPHPGRRRSSPLKFIGIGSGTALWASSGRLLTLAHSPSTAILLLSLTISLRKSPKGRVTSLSGYSRTGSSAPLSHLALPTGIRGATASHSIPRVCATPSCRRCTPVYPIAETTAGVEVSWRATGQAATRSRIMDALISEHGTTSVRHPSGWGSFG